MSISYDDTVDRTPADWPLPAGAFHDALAPKKRSRPRVVLRALRRRIARRANVLAVVLAVVVTGTLTAAVFVGMWTRESARRKAVEAELVRAKEAVEGTAAATRRLRLERVALEKELLAAQRRAVRVEKDMRALTASVAALVVESRAVATELTSAGLDDQGAGVAALAKRLGSVSATLTDYLETTSAAEYDPGFVRAQLSYLSEAIGKLQSAATSLAATAAEKQQLAGDLQTRAERVAVALKSARARRNRR